MRWCCGNLLVAVLALVSSAAQATSLFQALQNSGASQFAALIESDPDAAAVYFSSQVQTVFAPIDGATNSSMRRLRRRQSSPRTLQRKLYQSTSNTNSLGSMSSGSGLAMRSNYKSAKLGGKAQVFVSNPLNKGKIKAAKRWDLESTITQPTTVFITVPTTELITLLTTIHEIDLTTVHDVDLSTVVDIDLITVSTTELISVPTTILTTVLMTVSTTLLTTMITRVHDTELVTVPTLLLTTVVTSVPTTWVTTVPTTVLITVPTAAPTTLLTTVITTVHNTELVTAPTTLLTTVITTGHDTALITAPTTLLATVINSVHETELVTAPTTLLTTVITTVHDTELVTVSTILHDIELVTVPTTVLTTTHTTVSTLVTPSALPSLLEISSGLGNVVNIIQGDIPYDGGFIHIVDDYFTLPESLTDTANANGQTAFTGLASSYSLTDTLDNTPEITCFIPTNAAFAVPGATGNYSSINSLLLGHVIPNFVGYLPSLMDGTTYTSQSGTTFTVTVNGSDYYINNAKIVTSNVIVDNGVAHVIDQVIQPLPTQTGTPSSGASLRGGTLQFVVLIWSIILFLIPGVLM